MMAVFSYFNRNGDLPLYLPNFAELPFQIHIYIIGLQSVFR